jgi:hypothetical protein
MSGSKIPPYQLLLREFLAEAVDLRAGMRKFLRDNARRDTAAEPYSMKDVCLAEASSFERAARKLRRMILTPTEESGALLEIAGVRDSMIPKIKRLRAFTQAKKLHPVFNPRWFARLMVSVQAK